MIYAKEATEGSVRDKTMLGVDVSGMLWPEAYASLTFVSSKYLSEDVSVGLCGAVRVDRKYSPTLDAVLFGGTS